MARDLGRCLYYGGFGDLVRFEMPGGTGGGPFEMLVLGEMNYSQNGDVLLLGDGKAWGMPCNRRWCTPLGTQDLLAADQFRHRYLERYPGTLKPNAAVKPRRHGD